MLNKKRICVFSIVIMSILLVSFALIFFTPKIIEKRNELQNKWNKVKDEKNVNIPKVYFFGNMDDMNSKSDVRDIKVIYDSGVEKITCYATIKVQGTSSLAFDKKNYTINLFADESHNNKLKYDFGFGVQSKYCLKANWIDNTHARNIVSARLSAILQKDSNQFTDTPNNGLIDGFPVEIYMDDKFHGLYTFNIPKDAWMWNLDKDNEKNVVIAYDEHTQQAKFKEIITDPDEAMLVVEEGEYSEELKNNINRLITFVKDSTDEEFVQHFEEYINKESALNYILMVYVLNAIDNLDKNMMLVSYDQQIWYPSLYDLDTTFGTDYKGESKVSYDFRPEKGSSLLWNRVINLFNDDIKAKYKKYRKSVFTKEYIMEMFNEFRDSIPESTFEAEKNRWPDAPGYDYSQIEEYLDYKLAYLDGYFGISLNEL